MPLTRILANTAEAAYVNRRWGPQRSWVVGYELTYGSSPRAQQWINDTIAAGKVKIKRHYEITPLPLPG